MSSAVTIGDYLIEKLRENGIGHVFGVPGDFILRFYDMLVGKGLPVINTCDEQGAGFAADIYARIRGLGAVCVTYGVGGLKVANTTAQAFAERSPVVVISGAPGVEERQKHPLLHHKAREFDTQRKVFEELTVASAVLDDAYYAIDQIDRAFAAALHYKRPVYIELPRDMVAVPAVRCQVPPVIHHESDAESLHDALAEGIDRLTNARHPVIIAGVEVHRFGLAQQMLDLARATNIPVADTLLSKSVISEREPFYLGLYQGGMSREAVREYVESSDCVLLLGVLMTDVDSGVHTARLDPRLCINATFEKLSIGYHTYECVRFEDFLAGLLSAGLPARTLLDLPGSPALTDGTGAAGDDGSGPITVQQLFQHVGAFLTPDIAVITDTGDSMFASGDLKTYQSTDFFSPAYYCSLGYAVPAAIGAQLANPQLRPLVLVGDGAFQMTGLELSTAARYGLNPIVVVLNNGGYATERYILDGPFNDVLPWQYHRLPDLLGKGRGFVVETAQKLDAALSEARKHTESFCLLDVRLDPLDVSAPLKRLAEGLAKQHGGG